MQLKRRNNLTRILLGSAIAAPLALCCATASAETRGYVISWFANATRQ